MPNLKTIAKPMFKLSFSCVLGDISLYSDGKSLIKLDFAKDKQKDMECKVLLQAAKELELYFSKKLQKFSIPLATQGSVFEQKVYQALCKIPYGKTATYKEIAEQIGHRNAFRAVGNANAKNDIPIFIPCHRVLASNGLGGYSGGLHIKKFLLKLENINFQ